MRVLYINILTRAQTKTDPIFHHFSRALLARARDQVLFLPYSKAAEHILWPTVLTHNLSMFVIIGQHCRAQSTPPLANIKLELLNSVHHTALTSQTELDNMMDNRLQHHTL